MLLQCKLRAGVKSHPKRRSHAMLKMFTFSAGRTVTGMRTFVVEIATVQGRFRLAAKRPEA
jgi:hypothetical protein